MMLVEDGKIGLDEKIGKYLGGVPEAWSPRDGHKQRGNDLRLCIAT